MRYLVRNGVNDLDMFDRFFKPTLPAMDTDLKETEDSYVLDIDLPGFEKEEIELGLDGGYLTVSAKKIEKEENEKFIKRERRQECSRSYYVGNKISEEDIAAKYANGVLEVTIPKDQPKKEAKKIVID